MGGDRHVRGSGSNGDVPEGGCAVAEGRPRTRRLTTVEVMRVTSTSGGPPPAGTCREAGGLDRWGAIAHPPAGPRRWSQPGSNRRPPACKAGALPSELWPRGGFESSGRRFSLPSTTGPEREDRQGCGRHFDGIGSASCVGEREARESLPLATEGQAHRGRACGAMTGRHGAPALACATARSRPRRAGRRRPRRARARPPRTSCGSGGPWPRPGRRRRARRRCGHAGRRTAARRPSRWPGPR